MSRAWWFVSQLPDEHPFVFVLVVLAVIIGAGLLVAPDDDRSPRPAHVGQPAPGAQTLGQGLGQSLSGP